MRHLYNIETVLHGVGSIRTSERMAIRRVVGNGVDITHNRVTHELHLCWNLDADDYGEAIDAARVQHGEASRECGTFAPRTTFFSVREIDEN